MSEFHDEYLREVDTARESLLALKREVVERQRRGEADAVLWQESIAASAFDQARSRHALDELLHYGHFIPLRHGLTRAYVEKNYPGWSWNELIELLTSADVVRGPAGSPPRCRSSVGAVHFSHDGSWLVEWQGGRVTASGQ